MKENIAQLLKREGYVAEVAVEGKPIKKIKINLKYTGRKPVIEGLAARQFAGIAAVCRGHGRSARAGRDGNLHSLNPGGNHDGRAGAQEECGGRIALRGLVT